MRLGQVHLIARLKHQSAGGGHYAGPEWWLQFEFPLLFVATEAG